VIPALIVVPQVTATIASRLPCANGALRCAPLVIFHHGLNGGRAQMLLGADDLAAKGFVVAAIDAPKHGDRAFARAMPSALRHVPTIGGPGTQGIRRRRDSARTPAATGRHSQKKRVLCASAGCTSAATDGISCVRQLRHQR